MDVHLRFVLKFVWFMNSPFFSVFRVLLASHMSFTSEINGGYLQRLMLSSYIYILFRPTSPLNCFIFVMFLLHKLYVNFTFESGLSPNEIEIPYGRRNIVNFVKGCKACFNILELKQVNPAFVFSEFSIIAIIEKE